MLIECKIAILCIFWGSLRLTIENQIFEYLRNNLKQSITNIFICLVSGFILKTIVDIFKNDTIKELL